MSAMLESQAFSSEPHDLHALCDAVQKSESPVMVGHGVPFERTRRITGYLVGTLDRFNDAKRAEEQDRLHHGS